MSRPRARARAYADQFAYVLRTRAPIREGIRLVTCTGSFTNGIYTLDGSFVWLFNTFAARFSALRDVQVDTESIFLTYPLFSNDAFFHSFKWKFNGKFNVIEL